VRHVERVRGNEKYIKDVVGRREGKLTLEGAGHVWRYSPGINIDTTEMLEVLECGIYSSRQMEHVHCSCQHGSTVLNR
jgi:hypothetical protein